MKQDINYNGYTTSPPDYKAPDGDLAVAINLINEDGALRPILPPRSLGRLPEGCAPLCIHETPSGTNLIFRDMNNGVHYAPLNDLTQTCDIIFPEDVIASAASSMGNFLIFTTDHGIFCALWKSGTYQLLGSNLPFPTLEMDIDTKKYGKTLGSYITQSVIADTSVNDYGGLLSAMRHEMSGYGDSPSINLDEAPANSASLKQDLKNAIFARVNEINAGVQSDGLFWQPFFVRYAIRLIDGSHVYQSPPVLIYTTTTSPEIRATWPAAARHQLRISPQGSAGRLVFRANGVEALKQWRDIVSGIDIAVSAPIYTYKYVENPDDMINYGRYTRCFCKNLPRIDLATDTAAASSPASNRGGNRRPTVSGGTTSAGTNLFLGHTDGADIFGTLESSDYFIAGIPANESFFESVMAAHDFHIISSLDLDKMSDSNSFVPVPIDSSISTSPNALRTLPALGDDQFSHATYIPKFTWIYNARVHGANITFLPAPPFALSVSEPNKNGLKPLGKSDNTSSTTVNIQVFLRINQQLVSSSVISESIDYDIDQMFPRYLFYPDARAYELRISTASKTWVLPLSKHDFLNGSYWISDLDTMPSASENAALSSGKHATPVLFENMLRVSEVNNPVFFPAANVTTIGSGTIMGLSSAAKALSQGQFGQFPLYAFTDTGVWALEIAAGGTYSARQPITRDVCINPAGITQIDSAVLFPTNRGIMLLSGSECQCISEAINNESTLNVLLIPGMAKLHSMLGTGHESDSCLPTVPLSKFLKDCSIIYDYIHQRIIAYSPDVTYAYIFSLKSQCWGMMHSNIANSVNSYPNALAVDKNGHLVDFSINGEETSPVPALLVTRPITFGTPDILKTIDTAIQRGDFAYGHIASVLYGSRNLHDWHLVWSSRDHYLRGFRGTPYKYFRLAALCFLNPGESIAGASVQFTPRLTNNLR